VLLPQQYGLAERPKHPVLEEFRRVSDLTDELDEAVIRKAAAAYYGLCSFLDAQVGIVLEALERSGLAENTRIVYTSDHGDTLGEHGVWFKHTMYEGSAGVPFIMAGPDIPKNRVVDEPVSLVDCYPTIVEAVGAHLTEEDSVLDGDSLFPLLMGETTEPRVAFSEYHASQSVTGYFMIRYLHYKYIYYVGYQPQLFDLEADPGELNDLSNHPEYSDALAACEKELRAICDPEEVDARARAYQRDKLEANGGREAVLKEGFTIPYSPTPTQFQ
jgi:choline-sulfatase